ncbi:hypothetical protein ACLOJK_033389 [Asimina triloba]
MGPNPRDPGSTRPELKSSRVRVEPLSFLHPCFLDRPPATRTPQRRLLPQQSAPSRRPPVILQPPVIAVLVLPSSSSSQICCRRRSRPHRQFAAVAVPGAILVVVLSSIGVLPLLSSSCCPSASASPISVLPCLVSPPSLISDLRSSPASSLHVGSHGWL